MSGSGPEQPFGSRNHQPLPFGRQSSAPSFGQSTDTPNDSQSFDVSPITHFPPSSTYPSLRSGLDWQTRAATANHLLSTDQPDNHLSGRDSPDPDDFYRQQDRLTTENPHVTSDFGDATASANNGMASGYGDLTDRVSPLPSTVLDPSRQRRPEFRSVSDSPTLGGQLPKTSSAASSMRTRQSRQSSFKDLVNKFNNTSDQVLPLPSISRTTSRTASPAGSADGSERRRTLSRRQTSCDSPPPIPITSQPKPPVASTPPPLEEETLTSGSLSLSTAVPPPLFQRIPSSHPRRPLFGELLSVNTELNNLGFGLPATGNLKRRGSDGSIPSPNPASALSPLTPTAWYLGQASSLEAVQPGASKTSSHRRVQSDSVGSAIEEPESLADPWDSDMAVSTPLQRAKNGYRSPDSPGSPGSPNSRSRIPVSAHRLSPGSGPESSASNPTFSSRSTDIPLAPKGTSRLPKPCSKDSSPHRMAGDGPASFAMTARGRRDLTIGRTRSQVPERNQLLQAYIAAPPPKKSPPLRSSRPRQPVSHGLPPSPQSKVGQRVSSLQNSSERDTEARAPRSRGRPLPELGNVDFEIRRQRIQQAINRTVQENERREEAAAELRRRAKERETAHDGIDTPADDEITTPKTAVTATALPLEMSTVVTQTATPSVSEAPEKEPHNVPQLHLNTALNVPDDNPPHTMMDSPTLGVPDELSRAPAAAASYPMRDDAPDSANTSDSDGTHVTTFDPEPQSGLQERKPSMSHQTLLNHIMQIRESSSGSESCDEPDCSPSDTEDKESIQIMLRNSNYMKSPGRVGPLDSQSRTTMQNPAQSTVNSKNRWSMSSWSSSLQHQTSTCDESDGVPMYAPTELEAESANQSCSATSSSPASDVAGDYPFQDIGVMGPSTLEASRNPSTQMLSNPPSLARQGRWDSRRATQLYLQELTRSRHNNSIPEQYRTADPDLRADGRVDSLTEDPVVIPGYQEVPFDEAMRTGASLRGPEDWEHASPSMYDWLKIQAEHEAATPRTDDMQFSPEEMPTPRIGYSAQVDEAGHAESGLGLSLENGSDQVREPRTKIAADQTVHFDHSNYPPPGDAPALRVSRSAGSSDDSSFRPLESTQSPQAADSSATSLAPSENRAQVDTRSSPSPEQRRLKKRRHIIKELVDTEYKFGRDMKVVDDIYKGTAVSCSDLTKDDIKVIFGNSDQVVQFSFAFQDTLKKATRSIYVMPKSQRWNSKRSAQSSRPGSPGSHDLPEDVNESDLEKDRSTSVGEAFLIHLSQMEKAHATNLKTRDSANKKLETMQQRQNVTIWLNECREWASDLTDAWDLSSLLVKPFQRVLKYPLLLKSLLESTPTDHPDYQNLTAALQKTNEMTERLNKLKGRVETFDQSLGRGRKESDVRANLSKAFGRRTEKLRQQVGLSEMLEDKVYHDLSNQFSENLLQLQVIVGDIGGYTAQAEQFGEQLVEVCLAIEGMLDVAKMGYPELESKWRQFKMTAVDIRTLVITEHIEAVQKSVMQPIDQVIALHTKPFRAMKRREKRLLDHARYKVIEERGDTPDKKVKEQEEHFEALDETLKEELPQLYNLSRKLTQACLKNFVALQSSFLIILQRRLEHHIDGFPPDFQKILNDWTNEHSFVQAQVLTLSICNGSFLADTINLTNFNTPSTTVNSPRRPSTVNSSTHRPGSMSEDSPKVSHDYGVGQLFQSPQIDSQSTFSRTRANSSFSGRPHPDTPDTGRSQLLQQVTNSSASNSVHASKPATETEPFPSLPRLSLDTPFLAEMISASSSDHNLPTSPGGRYSGFFSSAMPMSDNPNEESRTDRPPTENNHMAEPNVLFLAASVEQFDYQGARGEAGYPYLTYESGDIFDVIGEKGELWLARNQDDASHQIGWIWNKHFSKVGG